MSAPVRISLDSGQRSASDSEKKLETIPVVPLSDDVEKAPSVSVPVSDWSGPDDPLDPHNWSRGKRAYHVFPPAVISFVATFATSVYTPSYPQVMERFGVSSTVALLPLSLYVLAIGFGPIIGAPLSETYGRHVVYLASPPIAALFTLGAGFSQNFASLAICRFFAGLFFSPALAIGAGSNADVFHIHERAIPTVFYIISPFLGPSLGPTIGGFVTVRKGWQWTQWTIIFFAIFGWVAACGMSETHKGTILSRRNKSLGIAPPPSPFKSTSEKIHFLFTVTLFRPLHMLFTEPLVGFFSLYTAFNFGVLYTFFASFPYVFGSVYHFNVEQSGLVFLAMGIGSILGLPTIVILNKRYYLPAHAVAEAEGRIVAPEHRLYPAMIGSIGMPLGLFWFAWTARSDVSWVSPVMAAIPFAWANLVILMGCATYLVDTYQALNGASALAANGILRYGFGAAFPLFALQMYRGLGIAWATSLLGFVSIALMPIPWIFFKYGSKIRTHSSYDTIKA